MLQEYPFLRLRPLNIVRECFHLNLLTPRNRIKEIEESPDLTKQHERQNTSRIWLTTDLLNFAVFAFAVDDMNALDCVITSAKPCAFLTK
jgi:hypothetical protein